MGVARRNGQPGAAAWSPRLAALYLGCVLGAPGPGLPHGRTLACPGTAVSQPLAYGLGLLATGLLILGATLLAWIVPRTGVAAG